MVSTSTDVIVERANEGTDSVQASVTYSLAEGIEHLTLTGTDALNGSGNTLNNRLTGNTNNNWLRGGGGNDTLLGLAGNDNLEGGAGNDSLVGDVGNDTLEGGVGADTMDGGAGDDIYAVDNAGDVIADASGWDWVQAYTNYTLPTFMEMAWVYTGEAITLTGNSGANELRANAEGAASTLVGGAGNDLYRVYGARNGIVTMPTVVEAANEGYDTLWVNKDYHHGPAGQTISLPDHIEKLDIHHTWGISGRGNALDNDLVGTGRFNANSDGYRTSLEGLSGNDTYRIYSIYTQVIEAAGDNADTVVAYWGDHRLAEHVENLQLANDTRNINGFGNSANNNITGNNYNNLLDGGAGNDTLTGGFGDDVFLVDSALDQVNEASNQGIDTVRTALATYSLPTTGSFHVENLQFTSAVAHVGTGNALNNVIEGHGGNDSLAGLVGNDTLWGGAGQDTLDGGEGNDRLVSGARLPQGSGVQSGLKAEYYNNRDFSGTPGLTRQDANIDFNWSGGAPGAGVNTDNFSSRWTGWLNISTPGLYTFRFWGDDQHYLSIDQQRIIDGNGNGTFTSLAIYLEAGAHSFEALQLEGGGGAGAQLMWQAPGSGTFTVVPSSVFTSGTAPMVDATGDLLQGGAGNDTLEGSAFADTLVGGSGDDTYVISGTHDTLTEQANEGSDTVVAGFSVNLGDAGFNNIENATLSGSGALQATGTAGANVLVGSTGGGSLSGLGGNDRLLGYGGSTLEGGDGNDSLSAVGGWSPAALPGLALWLDAADLDGDGIAEGTAEAGLTATGVATWADKSGNNRAATQTGWDNQPQWMIDPATGRPVVRFGNGVDGSTTNDSLIVSLPSMTGNRNSLFWVQNTIDANHMPIYSNNGNGWFLIGGVNDGNTDVTGNGNWHNPAGFWRDGQLANWATRADVYNGLNAATHSVASVNQPFNWNGRMTLGGAYDSFWNFNGDMTEVVLTSSTLSTSDRQLLEGYLAWKWGLQGNLPSDHPYKNAAPTFGNTRRRRQPRGFGL